MKLKMQKILKLFKKISIIVNYTIKDFRSGIDFYYYKAELDLKGESKLYIREFISKDEHNYSYHWQDKNGQLIIRWDNSPHHKSISTFPHHKHNPEIAKSFETNLESVLRYIEKKLGNIN